MVRLVVEKLGILYEADFNVKTLRAMLLKDFYVAFDYVCFLYYMDKAKMSFFWLCFCGLYPRRSWVGVWRCDFVCKYFLWFE